MQIEIKEFAFINPNGGTGLSDGIMNERFQGEAIVSVTKSWFDYEIGWRFVGEAISDDLKSYLDRNASKEDRRVFYGQFDLVDQSKLKPLLTLVGLLQQQEFNDYMQHLTDVLKTRPLNTAAKFVTSCAGLYKGSLFYAAMDKEGCELSNVVEPDVGAWDDKWKKELDEWFEHPEFFQIEEVHGKLIASCYSS